MEVLTTRRYPNEVNVDDVVGSEEGTGTNTPSGEPADDFFSSWDKPAIKRPSNPPSRTGTPASMNRTASPFLNANGNGAAGRPKSPLVSADGSETTTATAPAAASRAISSSAIRRPAGGLGASKPKTNILGAKKKGLGAKKIDASALDFDEAEKKAREEAERREKLGYDPDEENTPSESQIKAAQPETSATTIHQPTPVSPGRAGSFGSTAGQGRQRTDSEMERLGMGVRRLGFGQVGGGAGAAKAAAPKAMGFGSIGSKAPVEGALIIPTHIRYLDTLTLSLSQMTPSATPAPNSAPKRASRPTSSSAAACTTPTPPPRPRRVCKVSRARRPSLPTPTSAGRKRRRAWEAMPGTWRRRRRISCASLGLPPAMTWRT